MPNIRFLRYHAYHYSHRECAKKAKAFMPYLKMYRFLDDFIFDGRLVYFVIGRDKPRRRIDADRHFGL